MILVLEQYSGYKQDYEPTSIALPAFLAAAALRCIDFALTDLLEVPLIFRATLSSIIKTPMDVFRTNRTASLFFHRDSRLGRRSVVSWVEGMYSRLGRRSVVSWVEGMYSGLVEGLYSELGRRSVRWVGSRKDEGRKVPDKSRPLVSLLA